MSTSNLALKIAESLNPSTILEGMELVFRPKFFKRLRQELMETIPTLNMHEDRQSYYLHQVGQTHDFEDLFSLVKEMNHKQFPLQKDLVTLENFKWVSASIES